MYRKLFSTALLQLAFILLTNASHLIGGSIYWECLPNGNYRFVLVNYQDVQGVNVQSEIIQSNYPGLQQITLNRVDSTTVSPACNASVSCSSLGNLCYKEHTYTSDQAYPNGIAITQPAPATGWMFYYYHCCRSSAVSNIYTMPLGQLVLRAVLYNSSSACTDNSPKFLEKPINYLATGSPTMIPNGAFDSDGDSLVYDWGIPWEDVNYPAVNTPGYTFSSPFHVPSTSYPAPAINSMTGAIIATDPTVGSSVYGVQVTAYSRCTQQKTGEIYREFMMKTISGGSNNPPHISPPLGAGAQVQSIVYVDTVFAGSLYQLTINGLDIDSTGGLPQNIRFSATGAQFDSTALGGSILCPNPPCATVSPSLPTAFSGTGNILFSWQITCDHVDSCLVPKEYLFNFTVEDDFCPIRARRDAILKLVVLPAPVLPAPTLDSLDADLQGNVTLYWTSPPDPNGIFRAYCIYADSTGQSNYYLVDSLTNYQTNSYVHIGANANYLNISYMIKIYSGCNSNSSGLSTSSNSLIASFSGLSENGAQQSLILGKPFPNPSSGNFTLPLISLNPTFSNLSVIDLRGMEVHRTEQWLKAGTQYLEVSAGLSSGLYLVRIQTSELSTQTTILIK